MYIHDVIQIVDAYPRNIERRKQTRKIDPVAEAKNLSILVRPLGRNARKIAIVAKDDYQRLLAYQQAGYETYPMSSDRPRELIKFIRQMISDIKQSPPKHMVVVSDDPEFVHLCDEAAEITDLAVWANSDTVPRELIESQYGYQPLEELLPDLKIAWIDVRIDLENILIGLKQYGWQPNLNALIAAIREAVEDLGEIVAITGYADFDELNRHHGGPNINWQRELIVAGCESRYVLNQHGKNTADMKIADDIRTLVELSPGVDGAIDIICLVTMDRDFRHLVDTARRRGKKVVVLGLEGELGFELKLTASDVRYLNDFLKLPIPRKPEVVSAEPLRVFLCHSRNDKSAVRALHQRLRDDGIDPWLDEEKLIPGQKFDREIRIAVRNSDVVIVCLSNGSVTKGGYVQKEIKFALDVADEQPEGTIFVIPARLEDCDVPERLSEWHWVDLFEERGYERLLLGLKSINKRHG